ncbi:transporter [Candidatus Omnitrophota bacterium]
MRNVMVLTLGIFCMIVIYSSTVLAGDDLIAIDRHAKINAKGSKLAALGIRYNTAGDGFDKDSEKKDLGDNSTGIRVPIWARYVIRENLEAFAILPIISLDDGTNSDTGIGDIWLGAKYAIMPDGYLTLRGTLDIPTGDDKKDIGEPGGFGIDIAALTEKRMGKVGLFGQFGLRYNGEDSDTKRKPGMGFYAQGRVGYDVTEVIPAWISLTYFNQGDAEVNGTKLSDSTENWLELSIGGAYKITRDIWIAVPVQYMLTGTNTNADLAVGVYVGRYFHK